MWERYIVVFSRDMAKKHVIVEFILHKKGETVTDGGRERLTW